MICYAGYQGKYLNMGARLDIAIDVAHAITYLHMYAGIWLYLLYPYLVLGNPPYILHVFFSFYFKCYFFFLSFCLYIAFMFLSLLNLFS